MAKDAKNITLGELLEEHSTSVILNRLKKLAEKSLPEGWKDWTATKVSTEKDFTDKVDETQIDKLTFALPTVGLIKAFDPEADHISEVGYRQMKTKLLDWPFTRALIIGPAAVAILIRGSVLKVHDFKVFTTPLKSLMITREEADKILDKEAYIPSPDSASKASKKDVKYDKEKAGRILSGGRRRNDRDRNSSSSELSRSNEEKLDMLEEKFKSMLAILKARLETMDKQVQLRMRRRRVDGKVLRPGIPPKIRKR